MSPVALEETSQQFVCLLSVVGSRETSFLSPHHLLKCFNTQDLEELKSNVIARVSFCCTY